MPSIRSSPSLPYAKRYRAPCILALIIILVAFAVINSIIVLKVDWTSLLSSFGSPSTSSSPSSSPSSSSSSSSTFFSLRSTKAIASNDPVTSTTPTKIYHKNNMNTDEENTYHEDLHRVFVITMWTSFAHKLMPLQVTSLEKHVQHPLVYVVVNNARKPEEEENIRSTVGALQQRKTKKTASFSSSSSSPPRAEFIVLDSPDRHHFHDFPSNHHATAINYAIHTLVRNTSTPFTQPGTGNTKDTMVSPAYQLIPPFSHSDIMWVLDTDMILFSDTHLVPEGGVGASSSLSSSSSSFSSQVPWNVLTMRMFYDESKPDFFINPASVPDPTLWYPWGNFVIFAFGDRFKTLMDLDMRPAQYGEPIYHDTGFSAVPFFKHPSNAKWLKVAQMSGDNTNCCAYPQGPRHVWCAGEEEEESESKQTGVHEPSYCTFIRQQRKVSAASALPPNCVSPELFVFHNVTSSPGLVYHMRSAGSNWRNCSTAYLEERMHDMEAYWKETAGYEPIRLL